MGAGASSRLSREQREMYEANLTKFSRVYEPDIASLQLTPDEVRALYWDFADADTDGSGRLTETKWFRYLTPSVLRPGDHAAAASAVAAARRRSSAWRAVAPTAASPSALCFGAGATRVAPAGAAGGSGEGGGGQGMGGRRDSRRESRVAPPATIGPSQYISGTTGAALAAELPKLKRRFARRLFAIFAAREGSPEVDFGEFLASAVQFLPPLLHCVMRFAFRIYDADGDGSLTTCSSTGASKVQPWEVLGLAVEVTESLPAAKAARVGECRDLSRALRLDLAAARSVAPGFAAAAYLDTGISGIGAEPELTRAMYDSEFGRFALRNPAVLLPAARLQAALRARLGGEALWRRLTLRKLEDASYAAGTGTAAARTALRDSLAWAERLRASVLVAKRRDGADVVPAAMRALALGNWEPPGDIEEGSVAYDDAARAAALKRIKAARLTFGAIEESELATAAEYDAARAQFITAFGDVARARRVLWQTGVRRGTMRGGGGGVGPGSRANSLAASSYAALLNAPDPAAGGGPGGRKKSIAGSATRRGTMTGAGAAGAAGGGGGGGGGAGGGGGNNASSRRLVTDASGRRLVPPDNNASGRRLVGPDLSASGRRLVGPDGTSPAARKATSPGPTTPKAR